MIDQDAENNRRNMLKGGLAIGGGFALSGSLAVMSRFALAQGEELMTFTDMADFSNPPKTPGGAYFQDTRNIDTFLTPNEQFYVVQHYGQPEIDAGNFELRITGLISPSCWIWMPSGGDRKSRSWLVLSVAATATASFMA